MKKYTLDELKQIAKRAYPQSLKDVKANKYKVPGFVGYLLLDNVNKDGTVAQLFYDNKWRQDNINIIEGNRLYRLSKEKNKYTRLGRFGTVKEAIKYYYENYKNKNDLSEYKYVIDYDTEEFICDALYTDDVVTTSNNIHLYYEFMTKEDKFKKRNMINNILRERINLLTVKLDIKMEDFIKYFESTCIDSRINSSIIFGIEDVLNPIDDFIEEIKQTTVFKTRPQSNAA